MKKPTQTELIVRLLAAKNDWVCTHELIKVETPWGYLGSRCERRAFELAEDGCWDSPNNRYFIIKRGPKENGNPTRFTQFKISRKEPIKKTRVPVKGLGFLRDYTFSPA